MGYEYHSTTAYHTRVINTLGWELTLCNALEPQDSPCRTLLEHPASYGALLHGFLSPFLPPQRAHSIIEIGGGYGFLMRDFLGRQDFERIVMVDVAPFLIEQQKKTIPCRGIEYRCEDFLETPGQCLDGLDIAIMNENLGDFPTLTGLDSNRLDQSPEDLSPLEREAARYRAIYGLRSPGKTDYTMNIGALCALEKLCLAEIPLIYVAEHSCEAQLPDALRGFMTLRASGNPERIALYGHSEFTIRFSDLEAMSRSLGYAVRRGPIADFLPWKRCKSIISKLRSPVAINDQDEIVRQFIGDLYQYEYLVLIRHIPLREVRRRCPEKPW